MTSNRLSLAGAAISLAVLYFNLRPWWRGGRNLKDLVPFAQSALLGAFSTICAGGLLGWLAGCSVQSANTAGYKAIPGTTGTQDTGLSRGTFDRLTPEGGVVVFLLTMVVAAAWKAAGKQNRRRMAGGAFVGATLCMTAGVAGMLGGLPSAANHLGDGLKAALEGQGVL
ncbi:hypothetical protein [Streptomyces sp. MK37H]|uniref:hypothetical protein n=1 Tax=Streptomyces sp. MK37H TaxID=2699117 RepID=UPI001B38CCCB|nr:hypothetical protein [Streptomyces sp. MK37H]MBP8532374.1 hypothetical protein [Streptomyces sp. MK37H]